MNQAAMDRVIQVLKRISDKEWEDYLRNEPEWQFTMPLSKIYPENTFICFMLTAGLNDYQLKGRAEKVYWPKLVKLGQKGKIPQGRDDLIALLKPFYQNERFHETKINRLFRFLKSELARWLWQADKLLIADSFDTIWERLAFTMRQRSYKKTIVFAMKCLFIALRMLNVGVEAIKCNMPIAVDSRIKKITSKLQLLGPQKLNETAIQEVWQDILKEIQKERPQITIFHLDSYLWQMAGGIN